MSLVSNVFILFVAGSVAIYYILPQKVQWCGLTVMSYIYYLAAGSKYILFLFVFNNSYICEWKTYRESDW